MLDRKSNGELKRVHPKGLEIVDRRNAKARTYPVEADDLRAFRAGCCRWVGSTHLLVGKPRFSIINVKTHMRTFLPANGGGSAVADLSPDHQWLLMNSGGELSIGRLVLPADNDSDER